MGIHETFVIEKDESKITINLTELDHEKLIIFLKYLLFNLEVVPTSTAGVFIEKAELISEKDFLDILKKSINSNVAQKDTKNLLSFLRKISIKKFDSLSLETKIYFIKLHFELLKQEDLKEIVKEEYKKWPEKIKNVCRFYVHHESKR